MAKSIYVLRNPRPCPLFFFPAALTEFGPAFDWQLASGRIVNYGYRMAPYYTDIFYISALLNRATTAGKNGLTGGRLYNSAVRNVMVCGIKFY